MPQKIVINVCYGGFSLSDRAIDRMLELGLDPKIAKEDLIPKKDRTFGRMNQKYWGLRHIERNNPLLVQVVKEMGKDANGLSASLKIVEIPDGVEWEIDEYDGNESVEEKHRRWR